jgi:HD-GYP domain-containing protein (c-di-GMP phosphodiesterase class II)
VEQVATNEFLSGVEQMTTGEIVELSELARSPTAERAVEAVRSFLDMDVAYTTEFVDENAVVKIVRGDGESFGGMAEGAEIPLEQTYCQRVLTGRLPNVIPDVRADERAASLPITVLGNVGAYTSVPLTFSDGSLYGTLCAGSHEAKPDLGYRDLQFLHVFARMVADQLEREMLNEKSRGLEVQAAAASTLIAAVQARDAYTGDHSEAVVQYARAVAHQLGLSDSEVAEVEQVALLHDIGKIAIPDAILRKPGSLTEEEWEVMRTHPVSSERLIQGVPGLDHLAPAIRAEHEHWDGGGYPDCLAGEAIPLASRITLVCDAYHAMVSDRPYRRAMDVEEARAEIAAHAGTQFCPVAAHALLEVL